MAKPIENNDNAKEFWENLSDASALDAGTKSALTTLLGAATTANLALKANLSGGNTISGAQTLTGQLQLTGQSATDGNSAMKRDMIPAELVQTPANPISWRAVVTSGTVGANGGVTDGLHWYISLTPTTNIGDYIQRSTRYMGVQEMSADANMLIPMRASSNLGSSLSLRLGLGMSSSIAGAEVRILIGVPHGTLTLAAAGWGIVFTTANALKLQIHDGTTLEESASLALPIANNGSATTTEFFVTLAVTTAGIGTITLYQRVQSMMTHASRRFRVVGSLTSSNVLPTTASGGHIVATAQQLSAASVYPGISCLGCSAYPGVIIVPTL